MQSILINIQVIISILLMIFILVQNKDGGLSAFMGGSGQTFKTEKRGAEKVLHQLTIALAIAFLLNAFLFVLV